MANSSRRDLLKSAVALVGVAAAAGSLAACGESDTPEPAAKPEPKPEPAKAPEPAKPEPAAAAPASENVDPNDGLAKSLQYVEDASTIDGAANPAFKAGSHCGNCALFTGAEADEWGPCTLFAGKKVKNSGWCASWAPKA